MGLISRVSSRTYRLFKMLRLSGISRQVNTVSKLRLTEISKSCNPNTKFSTLLREDPILNLPPLQDNESQIAILGEITHVTQTHCLVNYGGKFDIRCPFEKEDKYDYVNWALDYHVGRKMVVNLNKHEDTDEFIGEPRPVSSYQATGKFIRFYEDFARTCSKVDEAKIRGEDSIDEESQVRDAGLKAEDIQ